MKVKNEVKEEKKGFMAKIGAFFASLSEEEKVEAKELGFVDDSVDEGGESGGEVSGASEEKIVLTEEEKAKFEKFLKEREGSIEEEVEEEVGVEEEEVVVENKDEVVVSELEKVKAQLKKEQEEKEELKKKVRSQTLIKAGEVYEEGRGDMSEKEKARLAVINKGGRKGLFDGMAKAVLKDAKKG